VTYYRNKQKRTLIFEGEPNELAPFELRIGLLDEKIALIEDVIFHGGNKFSRPEKDNESSAYIGNSKTSQENQVTSFYG
jgi:hypothetical protein